MSDHTFELGEFERHEANLGAIAEVVNTTIGDAQDLPNPIMYGMIAGPLVMGMMTASSFAAGQFVGGLGTVLGQVQGQVGAAKKSYDTTESGNEAASAGMEN